MQAKCPTCCAMALTPLIKHFCLRRGFGRLEKNSNSKKKVNTTRLLNQIPPYNLQFFSPELIFVTIFFCSPRNKYNFHEHGTLFALSILSIICWLLFFLLSNCILEVVVYQKGADLIYFSSNCFCVSISGIRPSLPLFY